jgi:hypothetical protein
MKNLKIEFINSTPSKQYAIHLIEDKQYYIHFGEGEYADYLGQCDLATPQSWLDPDEAGSLLYSNSDENGEGGEPLSEDYLLLYALGVRVIQDLGASRDWRGHYFTDVSAALEAIETLTLYESFPKWAQVAIIHGWTVPDRIHPCGEDEAEVRKLEAQHDLYSEVCNLSDKINKPQRDRILNRAKKKAKKKAKRG